MTLRLKYIEALELVCWWHDHWQCQLRRKTKCCRTTKSPRRFPTASNNSKNFDVYSFTCTDPKSIWYRLHRPQMCTTETSQFTEL